MKKLPDAEAACALVLRNAPDSATWMVGSFVERLFEDATFDAAACRELQAALLALIDAPVLVAQCDRHVFGIYRLVAMQLRCHLNPNDVCGVDNLADDAVIDLKNRFDHVIGSYFSREPFDIDTWWKQWPGVAGGRFPG